MTMEWAYSKLVLGRSCAHHYFCSGKADFKGSGGRGCSGGEEAVRKTFFSVHQIFQTKLYSVLPFPSHPPTSIPPQRSGW